MKPAILEDLPLLRRYLFPAGRRLCVFSPGVLMMWRSYMRLALHEEENTLTVRLAYDGGEDTYLFPIGRDRIAACRALADQCRAAGRPLCFFAPSEEEAALITSLFPAAHTTCDDGESDYLYDAAALATFRGKSYNGQRNHINRFSRLFPDHTIERITPESARELLAFLSEYEAMRPSRPLLAEELAMTREVLLHYKEYGMHGILLRVGDRIAAFACGEVIGDTLQIHIEKADTRFPGAYQRIVSAFAAVAVEMQVPYLNREDDMNDEGLRTSKRSYHPTALLPKWRITIPHDAL